MRCGCRISTHTSLWDVTCVRWKQRICDKISTHTSLWDVTMYRIITSFWFVFQLTHLYEMWQRRKTCCGTCSISTHTPLWDVTTYHAPLCPFPFNFNSHISMRCDISKKVGRIQKKNFNSHISMRCDLIYYHKAHGNSISTHTSLWDVTRLWENLPLRWMISTHTSLWDVTFILKFLWIVCRIFQLTHLYEMWRWNTGHR